MLPKFICFLAALSLWIATSGQETVITSKKDFLTSNIDSTVSPGEDFFMYANGSWFKRNPIPEDESWWGIWNLVIEDIYSRLKKINEEAAKKKSPKGSIKQLIGDFWHTAMDTITIEKQGLRPLQPYFDQINSIQSIDDLIDMVAAMHAMNMRSVMFLDYVTQDEKNSTKWLYTLGHGFLSIGLPDYYLKDDSQTLKIRNAFQLYLFKSFRQLGNDSIDAKKKAQVFLDLETRLAKAYIREDGYNKTSFIELLKIAPNINWVRYLNRIGINTLDSLNLSKRKFFTALNKELETTALEDWKNHLRIRLVMANAPFLDKTTFKNFFEYNKTLLGQIQPRPRWKEALRTEGFIMGEAVASLFAKEYFNRKMKQRYSAVVESLRDAFRERIEKSEWMSDSTKQKALEKLAKMNAKIGFPEKWKDYSAMQIRRNSYVLNIIRANEWLRNYEINRLNAPVDKTEWFPSANLRNAYYDANDNVIAVEPGSFAVPGIKDEELDDAFVYGYTFIGHEISHGFDDGGRNYDADGNLVNWWTKKDSAEFKQRAKAMILQYNEFNPVDTFHVNGEGTLNENIADLAGMLICLDAFKKTEQYKKNEKIGGFTPIQRFFLAYAYRQMGHLKKERLANWLKLDAHAPDKERVNGILMNIPEFYEAFDIKPGDKMYRPDSLRVKIW